MKLKGGWGGVYNSGCEALLKDEREQSSALIGFVKPLACGQASHLEVTLPSLLSFIVF